MATKHPSTSPLQGTFTIWGEILEGNHECDGMHEEDKVSWSDGDQAGSSGSLKAPPVRSRSNVDMMTTRNRRPDALAPSLIVGLLIVLMASGTSVRDAFTTMVVVAVQVLAGVSLWRLATWTIESSWIEALGVGVVIGVTLTAISGQAARLLGLPPNTWIWLMASLPAFLAIRMCLSTPTYRFGQTTPRSLVSALFALAGLAFLYWPWFTSNPLETRGWRTMFVDVPFFESLGSSLVMLGPSDNNMIAGEPVRYHWLTYAWSGATQATAASEPFVVISRVAPLVLGMAVLLLGYAWIIRLTKSHVAATCALVLLLTANDVGTGFGRVLFPESSSLILGGAFVLVAALLASMYSQRPPASASSWGWMFLAIAGLAAAGTAAKVAVALVLIAGGALASLAMCRDRRRNVLLVWTAAVLVGSIIGFLVTASGTAGGTIAFRPGGMAIQYDFMGPGLAVGIIALVSAIAAPWAGLAILGTLRDWRQRPEPWLVVGGAAAALLVAVVVDLGGGNQGQLPVVATAIAAPLSAAGVALAASEVEGTRVKIAASAASIALGMAAAVASQVLPLTLRWVAPISVVLVGTVAGLLVARSATWPREPAQATRWVAASASIVVLASAGSGLVVTAYKHKEAWTAGQVTAESQLSWDEGDLAAANWVVANTSQSDIIASSRWCKQPVELADRPCSSYWWLTSALTGRQVLVEGSGYWISSEPREEVVPLREESVKNFLQSPSEITASVLANQGVRWVWVDKRNTSIPLGLPYAPIAYENERVQILELRP